MARPRGSAGGRPPAPWVVGLDLSLAGTGVCVVRTTWGERARWGELVTERFGYGLRDPTPATRIERIVAIRGALRRWLLGGYLRGRPPHAPIAAFFVEQYAFSKNTNSGSQIVELGGAVKAMVWDNWQLPVTPVEASRARKILCGRVPAEAKSGMPVKQYVAEYMRRAGADFTTDDEGDAFVVANAGLHDLGYRAMSGGC